MPPGHVVSLLLQFEHSCGQFTALFTQFLRINQHAALLNTCKYWYQRHFKLRKHFGEFGFGLVNE